MFRQQLQESRNRKTRRIMPTIVWGVLVVVALFFIMISLPKEEHESASLGIESGITIERSFVSKSKSVHSFYPERSLPPGVAEISDDKVWNESLKKLLKTMTETGQTASWGSRILYGYSWE